jgi:hypothetical protein
VTLHKFHLLEGLAALELPEHLLEHGTEGVGLYGIEYLAHRGIAGHALDAVDMVQIVFGSLFVKGQ